ncbi:YadA-like family protein [Phyllobacterium sp. P30BS-XVII]|uniref:YadA-like family protein n=1 Tax=Phyllobacterium sp. P30BS-XVII TaxID=2587046 RepID=UPI0015FAB858|nr:YadA-like family protein [Phyllobacterium sp. P30BS-XVII]MBA8904137.1 autotransporter adhesin [Phyllobacterium sp. P30BS-XVII]
MRSVKFLLSATALTALAWSIDTPASAGQVTGTQGCVLKIGEQGNVNDVCEGRTAGSKNSWELAKFVTDDQINPALDNLQNQINNLNNRATTAATDGSTIVGDGSAGNPIRLSDGVKNTIDGHTNQINNINAVNNRQDTTLSNHETRIGKNEGDITNINNVNKAQDQKLADQGDRITKNEGDITNIKTDITDIKAVNARQDQTLDDHEKRITKNETDITDIKTVNTRQDVTLADHEKRIVKNEGDIAGIQDGAVFYNRDATGKKTSGVTFNDGTGNPVKLGNVAAGTTATDAVNVSQLSGALDGLGGGAKIGPDGKVTGPTYNVGGATYTNVGDALKATNKLSVQYVPDAKGNPTNTVALTGDGTGQPVKMTNVAAGSADTDAVNYGQVKNNIGYNTNADGSRGNSITLVGGSKGPVLISNVADGVSSTDAANVGQVKKARDESFRYTDEKVSAIKDYADSRIGDLSGNIRSVRKEARSGIASATAMAGLRYDDRPGKGSIAAGMGGFKSSTSIAAGVGYTTEDGKFRLNGSLGYGFEDSSLSWNTGASWTFN